MPDDRGATLRQIDWHDVFPWLSLVRAVRLAAAPRLVLLAALGLALTAGGWRAIGWSFSNSKQLDATTWRTEDSAWPWDAQRYDAPVLSLQRFHPALSPMVQSAVWLARPFIRLFDPSAGALPELYSFFCGLWALAVWSLIGGAITRIAALAMARDDRLGSVGGLKFGAMKWPAYFFAPLVPFSAVLLLLFFGWIGGLLLSWYPSAVVVAILWPILLLGCFGIAVLLLGLLFGWPLIWPTISTEGTDSFDGLSRSYSYTFQRPLYYLFFVLVAGVIGVLAAVIAWMLADWTRVLAYWGVCWGFRVTHVDTFRAAESIVPSIGGFPARLIAFWDGCVGLLALAYVYSYFWCAATRIYFLLRQRVDGTELDEVAVEELEGEETYGLPTLATDDTTVPRVVEPTNPPPATKPPESPSGT